MRRRRVRLRTVNSAASGWARHWTLFEGRVLTMMSLHEAHYRGYLIRGETQGWQLHVCVQPMKPDLPILFRHAFSAALWRDAVREAERLIDRVLSV